MIHAISISASGLVQSSGWPTVVAIMGNWFGKSRYVCTTLAVVQYSCVSGMFISFKCSHGMIFGFWSANASVGKRAHVHMCILHYVHVHCTLKITLPMHNLRPKDT